MKAAVPKVTQSLIMWMIVNMDEAKMQIVTNQIKKEDVIEGIHLLMEDLSEFKEYLFEEKKEESTYAFYKDNVIMASFRKSKPS